MNTQKENWDNEIKELENYFSQVTIPSTTTKLSQCETITNRDTFIKSHLSIVKANNGNKTFLPYLKRLQNFKNNK